MELIAEHHHKSFSACLKLLESITWPQTDAAVFTACTNRGTRMRSLSIHITSLNKGQTTQIITKEKKKLEAEQEKKGTNREEYSANEKAAQHNKNVNTWINRQRLGELQ